MIKTVTNQGVIFKTPLATFFLSNQQLEKLQQWATNDVKSVIGIPECEKKIQVDDYIVCVKVGRYGYSVNYVIKRSGRVLANIIVGYDVLFSKKNMDD